jgi:peptide/nickel transport system permease protein
MTTQVGGKTAAGAGIGLLPPFLLGALGRFLGSLALTFLGLVAVTFVIGRVVPIDPVLAVVGDRAMPAV